MLTPVPPMTNAERQHRFQLAHPGYDRRRKARERAAMKAAAARYLAAERVMATRKEPLLLPAPVVTVEIPGINMIPAAGTMPAPAPLLVSAEAQRPGH